MDAANRDLVTRLTQLKITRDKTEAILAARNSNRIKRHKDVIHAIVSSVEKSKRKVEELKIAAGEEMAAISTWWEGVEADIAAVDQDMDNISTCLSEIDQEQVDKTRKEQLAFEKELLDQKFKYNEELGRLQSSNAHENTSHVGNQSTAAKLPKLAITKFNGTNLDWTRFWGQFIIFPISRNSLYLRSGEASTACRSPPMAMRGQRAFCASVMVIQAKWRKPTWEISWFWRRLAETSLEKYINFTNGCCMMFSHSKLWEN